MIDSISITKNKALKSYDLPDFGALLYRSILRGPAMNTTIPTAHPRKSGGWEAIYYYDKDSITGKRKKISTYGRTKFETEERMLAKLTLLKRGDYIEPNHMTVERWFRHWLEVYASPKLKQSTYVSYRSSIENRIIPALGDIPISKLKIDTLQQFLNDEYNYGNQRKTGMPLSPKTMRNLQRLMHIVFQQAVHNELITKNYADFVVLPQTEHKEMRVLTQEESQRLFQAVLESSERHRVGILLCLSTGIRLGELAGLRWCDVDFQQGVLKIRQTLGRYPAKEIGRTKTEIVISAPKSQNSIRDIPIPAFLLPHLHTQQTILQQEDSYRIDGFVVCSPTGGCAEPRWIQDTFHRLAKIAQISGANCHCMRHSFATRAIEAGMDIKTLSSILGHADVSTTLNYYAHTLDQQKRIAMELVSQFYPTK